MKVFISWSGQLSKEIGEVFRDWLPGVLQVVKPYFTPDDVEKGTRWNAEIAKELEESQLGILLLTRENLGSPWVMFESGALSKQMERSRICPILFGIDNTDLQGPLVQFQATAFNKEDMYKLIQTINNACDEQKIEDSVLEGVFDVWWPRLEEKAASILEKHKGQSKEKLRSDRELVEETLTLVRTMANGAGRRTTQLIAPEAIADLVNNWEIALDAYWTGDTDKLKDTLGELRKPISHIARVMGVRRPERPELERQRPRLKTREVESEPDTESEE